MQRGSSKDETDALKRTKSVRVMRKNALDECMNVAKHSIADFLRWLFSFVYVCVAFSLEQRVSSVV